MIKADEMDEKKVLLITGIGELSALPLVGSRYVFFFFFKRPTSYEPWSGKNHKNKTTKKQNKKTRMIEYCDSYS